MVKDPLTYNKIMTIEMQKSVDFLTSIRIRRRADVSHFGLPDRSLNVLVNKNAKNITKIYVLMPF